MATRLRDRKRAPRYREAQVAFMRSQNAKRHAEARRRDRKAYDAYFADLFLRLFPNA